MKYMFLIESNDQCIATIVKTKNPAKFISMFPHDSVIIRENFWYKQEPQAIAENLNVPEWLAEEISKLRYAIVVGE